MIQLLPAKCPACGGALNREGVIDGRTMKITERCATCSKCGKVYTRTPATVAAVDGKAVLSKCPSPVLVAKKPPIPKISAAVAKELP